MKRGGWKPMPKGMAHELERALDLAVRESRQFFDGEQPAKVARAFGLLR